MGHFIFDRQIWVCQALSCKHFRVGHIKLAFILTNISCLPSPPQPPPCPTPLYFITSPLQSPTFWNVNFYYNSSVRFIIVRNAFIYKRDMVIIGHSLPSLLFFLGICMTSFSHLSISPLQELPISVTSPLSL